MDRIRAQLFDSLEFDLRSARLGENHAIAGKLELVNEGRELRLHLQPALIAEAVLSRAAGQINRLVGREFPLRGIGIADDLPFADDAARPGVATRGDDEQGHQRCQSRARRGHDCWSNDLTSSPAQVFVSPAAALLRSPERT